MTLPEIFEHNKSRTTDINEHLPTLYEYANKCDHVTELGARTGQSTSAFAFSTCKFFITYDLEISNHIIELHKACKEYHPDKIFKYAVGDSRVIDIEPTELLFIDTQHTYLQLKTELDRHNNNVSKYIIMHDTVFWGHKDEVGDGPGLLLAISEFIHSTTNWHILKDYENNSGLMILERTR